MLLRKLLTTLGTQRKWLFVDPQLYDFQIKKIRNRMRVGSKKMSAFYGENSWNFEHYLETLKTRSLLDTFGDFDKKYEMCVASECFPWRCVYSISERLVTIGSSPWDESWHIIWVAPLGRSTLCLILFSWVFNSQC